MTAKEKLLLDVLDLDETKAARARIVVADEPARRMWQRRFDVPANATSAMLAIDASTDRLRFVITPSEL